MGRFHAEIRDIRLEKQRFVVSLSIPYDATNEFAEDLREPQRIRAGFAMYLRKNEEQLSQFLYKQLLEYLIRAFTPKKANQEIRRLLRRVAPRALAGRPPVTVPAKASRYIEREGKSIFRLICNIQAQLRAMNKRKVVRKENLTDASVLRKLRREYPATKHAWISELIALKDELPRRRYVPSAANSGEILESTDPNGKLPLCRLSEPENWSTLEVATRVIQAQLLAKYQIRYPLRDIRTRLKSK